jgi:hypothetical protein
MQPVQPKPWDKSKSKQYEHETGQALFSDEQTLATFSQDFGKLIHASPHAISKPQTINELITTILFANQHQLAVTIRGNGLGQSGQSLPIPGGLTLSMQHFTKTLDLEQDAIWVEANATWVNILEQSLPHSKAPYALPFNCNLSIGGVLSAGGAGAASFKYGAITAHVDALEVVDGSGKLQIVDKTSPLFHACLAGQGRFGIITKAKIRLKAVKPKVKTFFLVYTNQQQWFDDLEEVRDKVDYMELFCSPSIQGAQLKGTQRMPMAQWLYGMHLSVEFEGKAPELKDLSTAIKPWNVLHTQEEPIESYYLRHNGRLDMMKLIGQWDLLHPWYECFVPTSVLKEHLESMLQSLPIHYANFVNVLPIAKNKNGFLMFPESDSICSFMILNPGVPAVLKDSCLKVIADLDDFLLGQGAKRYISGYVGKDLQQSYWERHFGDQYGAWMGLKQEFDPNGIFSSVLHRS